MIEHLDRIEKLGFKVNLNWNVSFDILYDPNDDLGDIRILYCAFDNFSEPSYSDIIETACDFFYMWYNKNLEKIKDYEFDPNDEHFDSLVETGLGDITKQVYRDLNIDTLLD